MQKLVVKLQVATNIAILITICFLAATFAKHYFSPSRHQSEEYTNQIGTTLRVPGLNWSSAKRHLILVLNTQCHFCRDSVPFYQRLVRIALKHNIHVVAVFPEPIREANSFLTRNDIPDIEKLELPLHELHVEATPTLLVVDSQGRVISMWVGKATPDEETQIIGDLD